MSTDINLDASTVKTIRDTTATVKTVESERAASRYRLLLKELEREYGGKHGWKTRAAERLGTDQAYVSRIWSRERTSVGLDIVERARAAMNLKYEFFHGPKTPSSYHDFVGGEMDAPYPAWKDFAESVNGRSMTSAERLTLASIRFSDQPPTTNLYTTFLYVMRGEISPQKRDATIEKNEQLRRENDEDDRERERRKPSRK